MRLLCRPWLLPGSRSGPISRRISFAHGNRRPLSISRRLGQLSSSGNLAALKSLLSVSEEVTEALATNKPVVALESTIYTHGALGNDLDLEGVVRRNGGVPAVVGILAGVPTVGLLPDEVARMVEGSPKKVSRRDIAYLVGMVRFEPRRISSAHSHTRLSTRSDCLLLHRVWQAIRFMEGRLLLGPWS